MGITSKNKGSVVGRNPITTTLCGLRAWGHKAAPTWELGAWSHQNRGCVAPSLDRWHSWGVLGACPATMTMLYFLPNGNLV